MFALVFKASDRIWPFWCERRKGSNRKNNNKNRHTLYTLQNYLPCACRDWCPILLAIYKNRLAFCSYKFLCGTINGEVHTGTNGHWHLFWRKYSDGGSQVVWGGSATAALQAMKKWVNHSSGTHEVMHLSIFTIHFQTCECLANTTKEAVLDLHFAVI